MIFIKFPITAALIFGCILLIKIRSAESPVSRNPVQSIRDWKVGEVGLTPDTFMPVPGNHFLAHAEWGCEDNEHKAWMIAELVSREQAIRILPSMHRDRANVTKLLHVTPEECQRIKQLNRYNFQTTRFLQAYSV